MEKYPCTVHGSDSICNFLSHSEDHILRKITLKNWNASEGEKLDDKESRSHGTVNEKQELGEIREGKSC